MSLPPYEPDGSLPALPAEEVTAKVLVDRYEVSKQTLYTRLSAIGVRVPKEVNKYSSINLRSINLMQPITSYPKVMV